MRLVSIAAGLPDGSRVEQEKRNAIIKRQKHLLFDPALQTTYVTHVVTRPASAVISNCVLIYGHVH